MSEQENRPKSFMQELDEWIDLNVVETLTSNYGVQATPGVWPIAVNQVKKAIREKILESYRNGIKADDKRGSKATCACGTWKGRSK